ncbi:cellobiose phosphorylase [Anaerotaenia torta]|uniref:GH36-type glycosyl hydrolase domain-containing protein n=1 Tax=Anaerotaenia torta TaxID=433293 RepID=UPI003D22B10C
MSTFGEFIHNGEEYCITDKNTPRPWLNYIWNDKFLAGINHFGGGTGAYGGRAASYIDPEGKGRCSIIREGSRYFYVKEQDVIWNSGWYPAKTELDGYRCVHSIGYSTIEGSKNGLSVKLKVFVNGEQPAEIWTVTLKNQTDQAKEFQVYFACDFLLEGYARYSDYASYVFGRFDEARNLVLCCNEAQERPHGWFNAFAASDRKVTGFDTSRKAFLGAYGSFEKPDRIQEGKLSNSLAACEWMVGALEHTFSLEAGEEEEYHVILGAADSMETAAAMADILFQKGRIEEDFLKLAAEKQNLIQENYIQTPDERVNYMANGWVKQQVQLCAEVGRDTGKGFRDQLQDAWAIAAFHPKLARDKIIETLRYQYKDGRCVRGWLPLDHHIYSDGPTWIAPAVNAYLKETGDIGLLEETVPYLDEGEGTVWEHILTAARYSSEDLGEHGLVLAHDGDWNDSLNGIGTGGRGESVWTSIALCYALRNTAEIAQEVYGDIDIAKEMGRREEKRKEAINREAWDGEWYLAAINDLGHKVGSHTEREGRIYLNSQTWAILSGVAEGERKEACLKAIDTYLESEHGSLTLYPAYRSYQPHIGRLSSFVPGIWENGTPYCHGGAFKAVADCVVGRGNEAYRTLCKIMPDSQGHPSSRSTCEPYALTNMYLGPENPRAGEAIMSWITGTAGWVYRLITQYMIGFMPGYETITIDPCIPSGWAGVTARRVYKGCVYHIEINNPQGRQKGVKSCLVDGEAAGGNSFPIFRDGGEHRIVIEM